MQEQRHPLAPFQKVSANLVVTICLETYGSGLAHGMMKTKISESCAEELGIIITTTQPVLDTTYSVKNTLNSSLASAFASNTLVTHHENVMENSFQFITLNQNQLFSPLHDA